MEEMKIVLRWEGTQFWMNPDNLLMALGIACPNTKFECEYIIHPREEERIKEIIKTKYEKGYTLNSIILWKIKRMLKKR